MPVGRISPISIIIKAHEINLSQFSILCLCNFCDEEWLRAIEYGARRVSDPMRPVRMPSRVKIAPVPSLYSLHTRIAHLLENREICVQHWRRNRECVRKSHALTFCAHRIICLTMYVRCRLSWRQSAISQCLQCTIIAQTIKQQELCLRYGI